MKFRKFTAVSAPEAIRQIRTELGPEAMVVHVRKVAGDGLTRLWRRPKVEVLATVPTRSGESQAPTPKAQSNAAPPVPSAPSAAAPRGNAESLAELRAKLAVLRNDFTASQTPLPTHAQDRLERLSAAPPCQLDDMEKGAVYRRFATGSRGVETISLDPSRVGPPVRSKASLAGKGEWPSRASRPFGEPIAEIETMRRGGTIADGGALPDSSWRSHALLNSAGFDRVTIQMVLERMQQRHGPNPPETLAEEIDLIRSALRDLWPSSEGRKKGRVHIFVGPAGAGKTTALCKWLTRAVLEENLTAQVCRLNTGLPNLAELLAIHAEVLGVPVTREWNEGSENACDMSFIDLPGVDWRDAGSMATLAGIVRQWPEAEIHLVLNAAYDSTVLLNQARGFESIPCADLILTHIDEMNLRGRLWNLILGTNVCVRFLGSGQNIPGSFQEANVDVLLERQFRP